MMTAHVHCALFLFYFLKCISALNFYNIAVNKISYATYEGWVDFLTGTATLELSFKTNIPVGLLLLSYSGTLKNPKYLLRMDLHDRGVLKVCFSTGCQFSDDDILRQSFIGSRWNDMAWHKVQVRRRFSEIIINIDGLEGIITTNMTAFTGEDEQMFLHFGGFEGQYSEGFTGCIENISYPIGSSKSPKWKSPTVHENCLDTCAEHEKHRCKNDGICIKAFSEHDISCDCSGTGFGNKVCDTREPAAYLDVSTIIRDVIETRLSHSRVNSIELRFRTTKPCGIMMYSSLSQSTILLELIEGNLRLVLSLGTGYINITAGDNKLHNGKWHSVTIKRSGEKAVLDIDRGRYLISKSFQFSPPISSCNTLPQLIYIGGYIYPVEVKTSRSKQNFEGCLQQVYVHNDVKRPHEYIRNALHYNSLVETNEPDGRLQIMGKLLDCDPKNENKAMDIKTGCTPMTAQTKLSHTTVAWITAGICVGGIAMIVTLLCGFHFIRRKYSGKFTAKNNLPNSAYYWKERKKLSESVYSNASSSRPSGTIV